MQPAKSTLYFVLSVLFAVAAAFATAYLALQGNDEHGPTLDSAAFAFPMDAQIALAR